MNRRELLRIVSVNVVVACSAGPGFLDRRLFAAAAGSTAPLIDATRAKDWLDR
jgi:hypothetical protein